MTDNEKKIFSLITAAVLTLIIVVIWFSFGDKKSTDLVTKEEVKLSSLSPMQVIKDEFSKAFAGFNDKMDDIASTTLIESTSTLITDGQAIPIEIIESTTTASTTISTSSEIIN